jgi:ribonuclease-3
MQSMSDELALKLGYTFNDSGLLTLALTHRSSHEKNNERIEFLGDSIVNFIIAEALFEQFPNAQEGELSRWRATLINRDTLADFGRHFEVGRFLHLGPGELKSGGSERKSILSCAMEAIIGAIYLDSDFITTKQCVLAWYEPMLHSLTHASTHKDPKTVLQEYLQSIHKPLPIYSVDAIEGEAHQQIFIVSCQVTGFEQKSVGRGTSRRRAEQDAAETMLGIIKK